MTRPRLKEHGVIEIVTTITSTVDLDTRAVNHDVNVFSPVQEELGLQVAAAGCRAAEHAVRDLMEEQEGLRWGALSLVVDSPEDEGDQHDLEAEADPGLDHAGGRPGHDGLGDPPPGA